MLPVKLTRAQASKGGAEVNFEFRGISKGKAEERVYRMYQTAVRSVKESGATAPRKKPHL
jgi:hypothetical protein